jgi:hypothetical protein
VVAGVTPPPREVLAETCEALDSGIAGTTATGVDAASRCSYFAYNQVEGTCDLYSGASTGPALAQPDVTYGKASDGTAMCNVAVGRCEGKVELRVVALPPQLPSWCCQECFNMPACVSWNFGAASGECTLLGGSCGDSISDVAGAGLREHRGELATHAGLLLPACAAAAVFSPRLLPACAAG